MGSGEGTHSGCSATVRPDETRPILKVEKQKEDWLLSWAQASLALCQLLHLFTDRAGQDRRLATALVMFAQRNTNIVFLKRDDVFLCQVSYNLIL